MTKALFIPKARNKVINCRYLLPAFLSFRFRQLPKLSSNSKKRISAKSIVLFMNLFLAFGIRILFLCFFALSSIAVAAEDKEPSKPKQEKIEEKKPEGDFFDNVQAPISYKGAFVKMMLTLLAIIALIVISVWMLRRVARGRMRQMNYGRSIKVIERRPLSAKSILYLVEIGGKKVVIAESQLEVRAITTIDELQEED